MNGQALRRWAQSAATSMLPLLLLGCSFVHPAGASAQERTALAPLPASIAVENAPAGYQAGGSLGFTLRDTTVQEQLYRRSAGTERGLIWTAEFTSRWRLDTDQLDRWSAQAIGLMADGLGDDVRLAGYERLHPTDIGEQRVAYRYQLATASGQPLGDATIIVFSRGDQVGLTGTASIGTRAPVDAASLARALDTSTARG
ncbi:MAG TPA: hypothetical protein VFE37_27090 [Chloroflexota bacterium]|nr:hypothetical protein [Chloroflexota bacterium]